jgi:hypothetical protein
MPRVRWQDACSSQRIAFLKIGTGCNHGLGLSKNLTGCGDGWGHDGTGALGYARLVRSTRDGSRQVIALINTSPSPTSRVLEKVGGALESLRPGD